MRWESGRPAWLGYLALLKALMVHTIVSTPSVLSRTWSEDERAIPKAAAFAVAGALVVAIPLMLIPAVQVLDSQDTRVSASLSRCWRAAGARDYTPRGIAPGDSAGLRATRTERAAGARVTMGCRVPRPRPSW